MENEPNAALMADAFRDFGQSPSMWMWMGVTAVIGIVFLKAYEWMIIRKTMVQSAALTDFKDNKTMNAKIVKISFVITMLIIALAVLCGSSVAYAETVMIGGKPVGITIGAKGLVVIETTKVITDDGAKNPTEGKLLKGDILKTVNGKEVFTVSDLRKSVTEKKCTVNVERKGETLSFEFTPALEALTKEYKLGLYVKEEVSGIGTISFVKKDGTYGALGHRISDPETGLTFEYQSGYIYDAEVNGAKIGDKNAPGELKGRFNNNLRLKV